MKYGRILFAGLTAEMQLNKAEYNRKSRIESDFNPAFWCGSGVTYDCHSHYFKPFRAFSFILRRYRYTSRIKPLPLRQFTPHGNAERLSFYRGNNHRNNSFIRESKHRPKASCFGKPKERAEARAH